MQFQQLLLVVMMRITETCIAKFLNSAIELNSQLTDQIGRIC